MSHVTQGKIRVNDLDALGVAMLAMGAELVRNKTTYNWFNESVGDYPLPAGRTAGQLGKCDHVIRVPGVNYEIGVVRMKDGTYALEYDFFGNDNHNVSGGYYAHDGQKLLKKFGKELSGLYVEYNRAKVKLEAKKKGFFVTEKKLANGSYQMQLAKA